MQAIDKSNDSQRPWFGLLEWNFKDISLILTRGFDLGSADEARESLLYSYKHSFNGFAAHLSPEEASAISGIYKSLIHIYNIIVHMLL